MTAKRFEKRMSDADALMWNIEKDPMLRSTITAISVFDRAPDRARLEEKLDRGTRTIARLRQRPVSTPLRSAPPKWMVDPNFDIGYHLRYIGASGDGSLRSLFDLAAPLTMQGFDRARPLWETYVVEGLEGGRCGLIQKVHHAVTDGVGGIEIALMLLDTEREPGPDPTPMPDAPEAEPVDTLALIRENLDHERRRLLGVVQRSVRSTPGLLGDPIGTARGIDETVRSAARLLAPTSAPLSPVMTGRSLSCRFDAVSASLPEMKAAAKKAGGRLNDAFLAAVAGGFRRYHDAHGAACDAIRVSMPINLREAGSDSLGGNEFAPARFPLPTAIDDPIERMQVIRELVATQRDEPALRLADSIALVLNRLPTSAVTALFGSMLKTIDCVVSNVPGLPFEVFLGGARQEAQFAMGPPAGAAVNITLLSYLDKVHIGIVSDPAAVGDPDHLVACLEEGIAEVLKV